MENKVYVFNVYFESDLQEEDQFTSQQAVVAPNWTEATKLLMEKHEYYMDGFDRHAEFGLL